MSQPIEDVQPTPEQRKAYGDGWFLAGSISYAASLGESTDYWERELAARRSALSGGDPQVLAAFELGVRDLEAQTSPDGRPRW